MSLIPEYIFSAGFVLIKSSSDPLRVREELLKLDSVRIAHPLAGPDNLICYVETYDPTLFRKELNQGIRALIDNGLIEHTETLVILSNMDGRGYSREQNNPAPAAAWLLCDVSVHDPETVIKELQTKKGVVNAHPVLGRYDLIAYVQAGSMDQLMRILDQDVRQIPGIRSIDTRLVRLWDIPANGSSSRDGDNQKRLGVSTT
jgi:DNA-binding Lrp family transcriptional regulator